jgi:hypothetical protein
MAKAIIQNISNVPAGDMPRWASINFGAIAEQFNGNLEFGPNIKSMVTEVVFTTANQVVAVPHTLGRTPKGYIVIKQNAAGSILTSELTNPWNDGTIFLNASVAMTATLIIV